MVLSFYFVCLYVLFSAAQCFNSALTLEQLDDEPIVFTQGLNDPNSQEYKNLAEKVVPLVRYETLAIKFKAVL